MGRVKVLETNGPNMGVRSLIRRVLEDVNPRYITLQVVLWMSLRVDGRLVTFVRLVG